MTTMQRMLTWVTPQLALCGGLPDDPAAKTRQLDEWMAAGVTHIVDTRVERSDEMFVIGHAPNVGYSWVGLEDEGGARPDEWFDAGVEAALAAIGGRGGRVLVHCHLGVNRGPSLAFAVMLTLGWDPVEALDAIRAARPVATVLHAVDATRWWHRRIRSDPRIATAEADRVQLWLVMIGLQVDPLSAGHPGLSHADA